MKTEIIELEKILDQEIEAYSRLEKYIIDKKEVLVNGDMEKLINIDTEIESISSITNNLNFKRSQVTSKFGDENLTLKELIERIEKEDNVEKILFKRTKLKNIVENVQRQNKINAKLIEHSLKLIEYSVNSIANALVPDMSVYTNRGKINNGKTNEGISSIIQEA